ncbi:MAG: hypothetical protein HZA51_02690 [Planctomycetes bacterium]|nr:hypothetical protein [Planctomycetota bacterium]
MKLLKYALAISALMSLGQTKLLGGGYSIDWHTTDGGGVSNSAGGAFELSGTIGQPDAATNPPLSGGTFELAGGFWPITDVCFCLGDLNGDGTKNGADIQKFVSCFISGGACSCADMDNAAGVDLNDISVFVTNLLSNSICP